MTADEGFWDKLRAAFSRRRARPLDQERDDLVVVVTSFDDIESCSTALERGAAGSPAWRPNEEAVLRHHLDLPADTVGEAARLAGQDGYVQASGATPPATVILQRVQVLDGLHCAQEKSRMASLAQRLGGTALGWDALQPSGADE